MRAHRARYLRSLVLVAAVTCLSAAILDIGAAYASPHIPLPFATDPYPSTYRPLPRTDTLIEGATILDGAGHRIDNGDVLIRGGKIVAVGHGLSAGGATVINAHGRWVTPGIIDVHSHDGVFSIPSTSGDVESSDVSEVSDPNAADTWIEHAVNAQDPAFSAALRSGVSLLAHYDPLSESMDPKDTRAKAERLLGQVPTMVTARARLREGKEPILPRDDLPAAANFLWMLFGEEPEPMIAHAMDVAFTLKSCTFDRRFVQSCEHQKR